MYVSIVGNTDCATQKYGVTINKELGRISRLKEITPVTALYLSPARIH
jgi:hypothetical protein